MTEDEMVGWYHQLNGHELEQTPEDSEGQGSLACCSSWGCKESDTTKQLNNNICWQCPKFWKIGSSGNLKLQEQTHVLWVRSHFKEKPSILLITNHRGIADMGPAPSSDQPQFGSNKGLSRVS